MSSDELRELFQFLHDRNPNVRQIALQNLLGHTPQGSTNRSLFLSDATAIRDLKILCRDQPAIAHDAFRALVNLSDASQLTASLSEREFLAFLCSYILYPPSILADLAAMILSNLTAFPGPAETLLKLKVPVIRDPALTPPFYPPFSRSATSISPDTLASLETVEVKALPLLVAAFADSAVVEGTERRRKSDLHFLASVFANLSATPEGRAFFLTPASDGVTDARPEFPLAKLVAFTEHKDTIRRGGVISTLKNCCFSASAHRAILSPDSEQVTAPPSTTPAPGIDALPYLLLPLAGPEEFDLEDQEKMPAALQFLPALKTREADGALRLMLVETLLLLCTKRWGRDFLRAHGVYEVVRAMHLVEPDENVAEHVERLVNLLKRDEPGGVQEPEDDEIEEV